MGFGIEEGPEIELDYYNFEALQYPEAPSCKRHAGHVYVSDDVVLRTHTSPVQVRVMEKKKPPLKIIAPAKVTGAMPDVSHTPMFPRFEGLMVDRDISFSHLKGVLEIFIHSFFGTDTPVRFRPSYFPFTEPSAEGYRLHILFRQRCRICKTQDGLR